MFTTLIESRARRARNGKSTTFSVIIHGAVIGLIVAITATTPGGAAPTPPVPPVVYVPAPVVPQTPTPVTVAPRHPALPTRPIDIVPIDFKPLEIAPVQGPAISIDPTSPADDAQYFAGRNPDIGARGNPVVGGPTLGSGGVIDAAFTDRAPRVSGNTPSPRYPSILRESGTPGRVTARFVVDTLGRVEAGSVSITETTHALFADAVRSALPTYRFSPGEAGGRKVRTLVQMPFTFTIR